MIGKVFALLVVVASVASAQYLSTGICGFESNRVLNVGCSVPVVSAVPSCSPVAVPSHVVDPIAPVNALVTPVVAARPYLTGVESFGTCESGIVGGYVNGYINGCGSRVLSTFC